MFKKLKTVEMHNLYANFGLKDGLSENELDEINGGFSISCTGLFCNYTQSCDTNGHGNDSGNGNGSGNSGGSSGSSASSSSGAA